jgi:CRISPR system Cascade subunit CasE
MFLSQLTLNPRSRDVQRDCADPYQMHKTLTTRLFSEMSIAAQRNSSRASADGAHGLLFRLDVDPRDGQLKLLAQSQARPDWSGLPNGYALEVNGPKEYDLIGKLAVGQTFRFRLRASPTKRIGNSTQFKEDIGKRVPIKKEDELLAWLGRKGEQHGFSVMRVQISGKDRQFGHKAGYSMQWHSVCFDGVLAVRDTEALRLAVEAGIGTAKGMGFGLLSLAPAPSPDGRGLG